MGFYRVLMPYLIRYGEMVTSYHTVFGVISFFAGICFAIGFFILIYNTMNANKTFLDQFPPNEFK
ncbi:hypothetical protein DU508_21895 [Pedobacter chinensis]|uniref:Uncharacterized protein n=1 Tax=Pedobacter chinensis TaxID=2282421 RepID=A0A369PUQ8_9SPHI|nr:hypothetical protein DU508_21895 [Pedobacter chinensis]